VTFDVVDDHVWSGIPGAIARDSNLGASDDIFTLRGFDSALRWRQVFKPGRWAKIAAM